MSRTGTHNLDVCSALVRPIQYWRSMSVSRIIGFGQISVVMESEATTKLDYHNGEHDLETSVCWLCVK